MIRPLRRTVLLAAVSALAGAALAATPATATAAAAAPHATAGQAPTVHARRTASGEDYLVQTWMHGKK
ncbi:hypothetical protein [Streptomyces sp. NPDC057545]|uniref:hypothetical protein n=1 Tax=Streptomyces sp. NPDC057545 TaxID=3346164 RepID=UPI003680AFCA